MELERRYMTFYDRCTYTASYKNKYHHAPCLAQYSYNSALVQRLWFSKGIGALSMMNFMKKMTHNSQFDVRFFYLPYSLVEWLKFTCLFHWSCLINMKSFDWTNCWLTPPVNEIATLLPDPILNFIELINIFPYISLTRMSTERYL